MNIYELLIEIERLPVEHRRVLIDLIEGGLGDPIDPEVEREHLEIIAERMSRPGKFIPGEEVLRNARALLNPLDKR